MKSIFRNAITATLGLFTLGVFTTRYFYAPRASAQTNSSATAATAQEEISLDFEHDVQDGEHEIENDQGAKDDQKEIENEDAQEAGADEQDHAIVIDGERPEVDIEQDIEHEVEIEEEGDHHDEMIPGEENSSTGGEPGTDIEEGRDQGDEKGINININSTSSSDEKDLLDTGSSSGND